MSIDGVKGASSTVVIFCVMRWTFWDAFGTVPEIGREHDKDIAPKAGHGVAVAHAFGEASTDFHQQDVCQVVSNGLVKRLEAIDVYIDQRTEFLGAESAHACKVNAFE